MKGYWTEEKYTGKLVKDSLCLLPVGTKIPESCNIVHTVEGDTYDEVSMKLWEWNSALGEYFIYIEDVPDKEKTNDK